MKFRNFPHMVSALGAMLALAAAPAIAQINVPWNVAEGSYSEIPNWDNINDDQLPDSTFDEIAVIGNGGVAYVDDTPDPIPSGVAINGGSTLEIRSGGNLVVEEGAAALATGNIAVNNGTLMGLAGGTLVGESLSSGGAGTIDLSGNTILTISGDSTLNGTTLIGGPDVQFTTAGLSNGGTFTAGADIVVSPGALTNTGTIAAGVNGAGNTRFDVGGEATLGGVLDLTFDGVTPVFGDSWEIVDAQSVSGNFASVASATPLGPGLILDSQIVGGGNGQIAQAVVDSRLTLRLNRRTGQAEIVDLAGAQSTTMDGYLISSPGGTLDSGAYGPIGGADWVTSTGSATHVGETSLVSSMELAAGSSANLGEIYENPARAAGFGEAVEDATFEYHLETGELLTGFVEYTDAHNNMVLVVDPDSGDAWIQNQSLFDVTMDGYLVESVEGGLDGTGWESLASSDADWTASDSTERRLGELNLNGSMTFGAESAAKSLGQIFTPGSEQDLRFTFHVTPNGVDGVGDDPAGMTFEGIVEYGDPLDFGGGGDLTADFNNDARVDGLDLAIWEAAFGVDDSGDADGDGNSDGTDFLALQRQYTGPASAAASVGAVPEPSTVLLTLVGAVLSTLTLHGVRRP
ncbi:MAG: hypothetical protein AAF961_04880 [Planctomycetota bacterium]